MPLPLWDKKTFDEITKITNDIIVEKTNLRKLDYYIMTKYSLTQKEINYIRYKPLIHT